MSKQASADVTSYLVPISQYDTHGLSSNYTLRRHKYEAEANAGSHEARLDWIKYIGPIDTFGNVNPINGNFAAVVLPLTKPERLRLIAYVFEYATLYDNIIEFEQPDTLDPGHAKKQEWKATNPALGKMQIEAKILTRLTSADKACAKRFKDAWKKMIDTTLCNKDKRFESLDEYVEFRIVDAGAYFVEALLLFGLGMTLSKDEDAQLDSIRKSCYTALSLANDYFSFDCEYANFQQFSAKTLPNSVWLCMQWHQVDSNTAKEMIKQEAKRYEEKFLEDSLEYRRTHAHLSEKLDRYLDALSYQVSGSTVWSLNCPRYHQDYRYDPNAGIEDSLTAKWLPETLGIEYVARKVIEADEDESDSGLNGPAPNSEQSRRTSTKTSTTVSSDDSSSTDDSASLLSSASSCSLSSQSEGKSSASGTRSALLDSRHVDAPYNYITSFPSKGVREAFADALNIWLDVPEPIISRIKALIGRVHATTLVFDDIEDGSSLRRGQPVTHKVFGIPQTINSGCYELVQIVIDAQQLSALSARNVEIVLEQLVELHIGQSYDLYWTHHGICPSEAEYVEMSAKKMGGFFQLLMLLLFANGATESTKNTSPHARLYKDVENLVHMIGVQYQILNDYQNLQSSECTAQKGFCEDLDEGKCSFPLIHALTSCPHNTQLREILQRKRDVGYMPYEDKLLVLEQLELAGSMEYTVETLKEMQRRAYAVVEKIEKHTGKENWIIRSFLQRLEV